MSAKVNAEPFVLHDHFDELSYFLNVMITINL